MTMNETHFDEREHGIVASALAQAQITGRMVRNALVPTPRAHAQTLILLTNIITGAGNCGVPVPNCWQTSGGRASVSLYSTSGWLLMRSGTFFLQASSNLPAFALLMPYHVFGAPLCM